MAHSENGGCSANRGKLFYWRRASGANSIPLQMLSQSSIRVQVSVAGDVQSGHGHAKRGTRVGFCYIQIHEDLLVAEVGRLLSLQIAIQKKIIRYRQDNLSRAFVFVFNAEAVFDKSSLRYDAKVSQLQYKILRHGVSPSGMTRL
jgi:hypothetical protein